MTIFDKKPFERGLLFFKSTSYNIYYKLKYIKNQSTSSKPLFPTLHTFVFLLINYFKINPYFYEKTILYEQPYKKIKSIFFNDILIEWRNKFF